MNQARSLQGVGEFGDVGVGGLKCAEILGRDADVGERDDQGFDGDPGRVGGVGGDGHGSGLRAGVGTIPRSAHPQPPSPLLPFAAALRVQIVPVARGRRWQR